MFARSDESNCDANSIAVVIDSISVKIVRIRCFIFSAFGFKFPKVIRSFTFTANLNGGRNRVT